MNDEEKNYELAKSFCKEKIVVHITKEDGVWHNGLIEEVGVQFFFIDDKKDGKRLVFFKELKRPIEEYKEVGE